MCLKYCKICKEDFSLRLFVYKVYVFCIKIEGIRKEEESLFYF